MRAKKIVSKIHLWLGLSSGLILFLSLFPASIFVWEKELNNWFHADYIFVEKGEHRLPLDKLHAMAQSQFPDRDVLWVDIENDERRSYVFHTYKKSENSGWTYFSELTYWDKIYIDPYTGKILGVIDMRYDLIYLFRIMHQQLLLNYDIGHWPVAFATLILIIMLISGLFLWWPRNKQSIKQRFLIKWKSKWRRKNYDIHSVGGFYSFLFILIFAVTGLVWSFEWWTNGIYKLLGENPDTVFQNEKHAIPEGKMESSSDPLEYIFHQLIAHKPNAINYTISIEQDENNAIKEYSAWITYNEESLWEESDYLFFHPQTGEIIHTVRHEDKSIGEKWRNSNYAIHVGSIWGVPTKILASFFALFCSLMPITGFLIWYGRKYKTRNTIENA